MKLKTVAIFILATVLLAGWPSPSRADCRADWNRDCVVTVQDIFDYLAEWFENRGDYNNDGVVTVQDIFDFLSSWFNGCESPTVRTRVYRVLRANSDFPGSPYNAGCRLTDEQINQIVANLQFNGTVFGPGVRFVTDDDPVTGWVQIQDMYTHQLPENTGTIHTRSVPDWYMSSVIDYLALENLAFYDALSYNIYFVGNFQEEQFATPPHVLYGQNWDPRDQDPSQTFAKTWINDGGFGLPFAFWTGYEPPFMATTNVLVHETGHYLGRLDQPIFAPQTGWPRIGTPVRFYDNNEHFVGDSNNLMIGVVNFGDSWPLFIPGTCGDINTELGQMFDKARSYPDP